MSERLIVQQVRDCEPGAFAALGSGLLEAMAAPDAVPTLLVAELASEAVLLGRHQRASSALERGAIDAAGLPVHRRLGGGRAVLAGTGTVGVLLAVPAPGALLEAPIPAGKVINRYVRGLLAGLGQVAGRTPVLYFGRDFLSAASRQLAVVSQDGTAEGPALFEALVAVDRPLALPAALSGYPAHEDPRAAGPEPTALAALWAERHDFPAIADRIAAGYERAYGCTLHRSSDTPARGHAPAVWEDESGWEESGVADVAIGFAEALVRHDGEKIREVRLHGDFVAPTFVLRGLEADLVGCPLEFAAIGARVDAAFRQPGATVLGLRSLRVLADAVLAAAGKLG